MPIVFLKLYIFRIFVERTPTGVWSFGYKIHFVASKGLLAAFGEASKTLVDILVEVIK
jgi:hypothetical protein